MKDRLFYVISLKLDDLANDLCAKNRITAVLANARVEGESLLLYLEPGKGEMAIGEGAASNQTGLPRTERTQSITPVTKKRRMARRKRNRMKTRGWPVVAKITNANGQTVNIYKPFADALRVQGLSHREQKALVAQILKSNNNDPSLDSVEYYLQNTLEYLKTAASSASGEPSGGGENG